jgi:hypothetical protein
VESCDGHKEDVDALPQKGKGRFPGVGKGGNLSTRVLWDHAETGFFGAGSVSTFGTEFKRSQSAKDIITGGTENDHFHGL